MGHSKQAQVGSLWQAPALFVVFMGEVAAEYPKGTVHIIWDNLNIHFDGPTKRWSQFNRRNGC